MNIDRSISYKNSILYFLIAGTLAIFLVPIVYVGPEAQTWIHPWKPELVGSLFLVVFSVWAYRSKPFHLFVENLTAQEKLCVLLPFTMFIAWSSASAAWANSWPSVLYHSTIWISYLAVYLLYRFFIRSSQNISKLIFVVMCFLWIICLPPLFEYYTYVIVGDGSTLGIRYSKYTEFANTLVPLVAAFSLQAKKRFAYFGFATVILVWLFDVSTTSRTGIAIFAVSIFSLAISVLAFPSLRRYRKKAVILCLTLFATAIVSNGILVLTTGSVPVVERLKNSSITESTNTRPFFFDIAITMWKAHPLTGVGADNYGQEFSNYRREYSKIDPTNPLLTIAEDQIPERAHNEYAQIMAELGTVGLVLLGLILSGIAFAGISLWKRRNRLSIVTASAFIGLAAFLASSLVTSYSFRAFQNGLAFMIVLAIAIGGTIGKKQVLNKLEPKPTQRFPVRLAILLVLLSSISLATFCVLRVAALQYLGNTRSDMTEEEKEDRYELVVRLDPESASIYSAIGNAYLNESLPTKAIPYFAAAIKYGRTTSMDYSYLATSQMLIGDLQSARETLKSGLELYPRSVFLHSRLGVILKELGQNSEAEAEFAVARGLDAGQAATWKLFIESGSRVASDAAFKNDSVKVMDLKPLAAVYAINTERQLNFPGEIFTGPLE